ncbi:MAG: alanine racemase [Clostridia bacterium]|nr:alanine racemase [Clostridia bacterium]
MSLTLKAHCSYCGAEGEGIKLKAYINLARIKENLASIRRIIGESKLMLMLKADAYGHGLEEVAKATCDRVDGFGVFSLEEGQKVHGIAPKTPVLCNCLRADEIESAVKSGLTIGLSNRLQLTEIKRLANRDAKIHLKVDSGMHRFGFDVSEVQAVCQELKALGVEINGVYSHFGDHPEAQKARFDEACEIVRGYFKNAMRHIASSHTLASGLYAYDGVRVGLAAYMGAMRVESEVVASRRVEAGEYVGYGDHLTATPKNIAVVFGGYADGIDRERFKAVLCRGREFKVIGVCMDSTIIDTAGEVLDVGEKALLLDEENISKTAENMQTIPYALMTAWRGRIEKIYV